MAPRHADRHGPGRSREKDRHPGLASWAQRATVAGIEVGIAGGLMAAYLAALSALSPGFAALQVLALLADTDIRGALAGGYWMVGGGGLMVQWVERGRTGQGLGGRPRPQW
ncbi:hypothetical protein ACIF6L_31845 [Kitasatospora sp. NPDC086009]|uniref:hypothetical protein n=1 Tax=unclassified Kitasatospora TaxID=2633591 RepID=UPI0037CB5BE9